jgi:hypothetical protein
MVEPIRTGGVHPNIAAQTPTAAPQPIQAKSDVPAQPVQAKTDMPRKADTVQISNEAQARSLRQQGMSIPEIALQLRLDLKTVTGFFPQSNTTA